MSVRFPGLKCCPSLPPGVSMFTFHTTESAITRSLSSGFSVGASLSVENLFDVLIGTAERCFYP